MSITIPLKRYTTKPHPESRPEILLEIACPSIFRLERFGILCDRLITRRDVEDLFWFVSTFGHGRKVYCMVLVIDIQSDRIPCPEEQEV